LTDIDALIERLQHGPDETRADAAQALARYGAPAADAIEAALASGDANARFWLIAALAELDGERALNKLSAALGDPDEGVRAAAAHALGRRGQGAGALLTALDDPSAFVSLQAAHALARMGPDAVPVLVAGLGHASARVRVGAARALAALPPPAARPAMPALIAALDDDSPAVQFHAEQALERLGVGMVLIRPA
jgi:HEAT repeat protein